MRISELITLNASVILWLMLGSATFSVSVLRAMLAASERVDGVSGRGISLRRRRRFTGHSLESLNELFLGNFLVRIRAEHVGHSLSESIGVVPGRTEDGLIDLG